MNYLFIYYNNCSYYCFISYRRHPVYFSSCKIKLLSYRCFYFVDQIQYFLVDSCFILIFFPNIWCLSRYSFISTIFARELSFMNSLSCYNPTTFPLVFFFRPMFNLSLSDFTSILILNVPSWLSLIFVVFY